LDKIAKIALDDWEKLDSEEKTKIESDLEKAIEKLDKCVIELLEELKKIKKELS
jgi:hypothetical protein